RPGRWRAHVSALRRRLAMDGESLHGIPGVSAPGRRLGRIQRQVHVQPDGSAWGIVRHAAQPRPVELPQLLSAADPLAVARAAPGKGCNRIMTRTRTLSPKVCPSTTNRFRADVVRGLRASQKWLPCKYFYDEAGSALFERITALAEYYLTRTERAIMERHAAE